MDRGIVGKRFVRLLLAGVLAVGLCPGVALAETSEPSEAVVSGFVEQNAEAFARFNATGNVNELEGTDAYEGAAVSMLRNGALFDAKFDLRDEGVVTPVKLQNPWGTCWSFGAIAAAETSIMTDLKKNGYTGAPLDLSELHTAWFSYMPLPEGSGTQSGEGVYPVNEAGVFVTDSSTVLNQGGMPFIATSVFSSGIGVVNEAAVPYKGKNGVHESFGEDWYYSENDDWSVDESLRFKQTYELAESSILPSPAGRVDSKYWYNEVGTAAMKKELAAGRAVEIAFCADTSQPGQEGTSAKYINIAEDKTWAHYTYDEDAGVTHAVTVVGWDDDYSKANFRADHAQPPKNGAWIVKNSWGSNVEGVESPHRNPSGWGNNGDGYFYLSYYDMSIGSPETFEFDVSQGSDSDYYLINQYDYMPSSGVASFPSPVPIAMANVFEASENSSIRSLSFETASPGTEVTYELWLLNDNYANPKDGTRLTVGTGTYEYGGYHRVSLDKGYAVKEGQHYAVVVTEKSPSGYDLLVDKSVNEAGMNMIRGMGVPYNRYAVGIVNKGESFTTEDGGKTWVDWTDSVKMIKAESAAVGMDIYDYDNFALKAYADPLPATTVIVPDLGNLTEANALASLEKAGLVGKAGEAAYSDTVEAGSVMGQDVPAGTEVNEGSIVTYMLSLGKKPVAPVVPEPTPPVAPTGGPSGTLLASTGDNNLVLAGLVSLGALLACGTLVAAQARLRGKKAIRK